jgi:SAM-dependent methyltransferase
MGGTMHGTVEISPPAGSAAAFYATPRGAAAVAVLSDRLRAFWPELRGMAVLGLGFAEPYLPLWQDTAYRCVAAVTAGLSPATGPHGCVVEDDRLPFPDLCFDRILLMHAVDAAGDARRLLREVWRVLKDDGRILVVAPNRNGVWAHLDSTPFGYGHPYSPRQLATLLAASMFRAERRDVALFVPPTNWRFLLRSWPVWEQVGHAMVPNLSGVTLTEAVKDAYAALPLAAVQRRHVLVPEAVPASPFAGRETLLAPTLAPRRPFV